LHKTFINILPKRRL